MVETLRILTFFLGASKLLQWRFLEKGFLESFYFELEGFDLMGESGFKVT